MTTSNDSQPPAAGDSKHTPTPWKRLPRHNSLVIVGQNGEQIALVRALTSDDPLGQANLAFIVRACNAYDSDQRKIKALTEALTEIVSQKFSHTEMVWKARAALALAKEPQ